MVCCSSSACDDSSSEVDETLFGGAGVLLRHLVELLDRGIDLRRTDILFAAGGGDLLDQLSGLLDVGHQLREHFAGFARDLDRLGRERADLGRRRLAAFGELAHFRGDHREAAAMFARPRRLDRGVQGEQIGLAGDFLDDVDLRGDGLHRVDGAADGYAAGLGVG